MLLTALSAGCLSLGSLPLLGDDMATVPVCQIVAAWHNEVVSTPDPTRGGEPTRGLAGRLYLFGEEIKDPVVGDGSLTVDLFDDTLTAAGKPPILIEEWRIDKETLRRLQKRDAVGWGYTLFLPWATYHPQIKQVHLRVRYEPHKGMPLYNEGAPMTLNPSDRPRLP